jgi:hypothetical protein
MIIVKSPGNGLIVILRGYVDRPTEGEREREREQYKA